jgi:predicted ribosomally synthesized peptide with SipW-like signal peptide
MKKTLTIILVIALLCVLSVGTTLTYFTDTDGNLNTMTVGEVDINQTINGNEAGVTETKLFPVTATPDANGLVPVANNGVNLEVVVTVDSSSEDAYVRTIFAFEMMKVGTAWVNPLAVVEDEVTEIHYVTASGVTIAFPGVVIYKDSTGYTTDATNATAAYVIGVATASNKLTGTATFASLTQVYLDSDVGNEFSTAVGGSYEILVLSQAVQVQGFEGEGMGAAYALNAAFGEVNTKNATDWFNKLPTT